MTRAAAIAGLFAALYLVLSLVGICWGTAFFISPEKVLQSLAGGEGASPTDRFLVNQVRLPQLLLLGLVGAAFACSGAALQATFDNPLADPGVLGVSSGASFGAILAIHFGLAERYFLALPAAAFAGALVIALLVYGLTFLGRRPTVQGLLLTGVAVGALSSAAVTLVMTITAPHRLQELLFWLVGGVRQQTWEQLGLCAAPITLGILGLVSQHRRLDALLLGEEQALAVGVPVTAARLQVLAWTALATGAAVAVSGAVGFVGLMVPHIVRRLTGPRTLHLLPACVTGGAAFLTGCELLGGRLVLPVPLHLGIVTAFLGVPAFLILLRRGERGQA